MKKRKWERGNDQEGGAEDSQGAFKMEEEKGSKGKSYKRCECSGENVTDNW